MSRSIVRKSTMVFGAASLIFASSGWFLSTLFLAIGALGLFLGVTDFGRQCPLFLSARHFLNRIKRKS